MRKKKNEKNPTVCLISDLNVEKIRLKIQCPKTQKMYRNVTHVSLTLILCYAKYRQHHAQRLYEYIRYIQ